MTTAALIQSYFDARDLVTEDNVGLGPAAKVLGSARTRLPVSQPIIRTDLGDCPNSNRDGGRYRGQCRLSSAVTVGRGGITGAAVFTDDVAPRAVAPGRFRHRQKGHALNKGLKR